jgi:hypothetical protein
VVKGYNYFLYVPILGFLKAVGGVLAFGVSATLEIKQRETPRTFVSAV